MRVICSVVTVNRGFGSQGVSVRKSKAIRSIISIIRKGGEAMLMHCTARNTSGCVYKLKSNIERVFSRMWEKGMATLRLKDPQIDLQISDANSKDVGRLLRAIKLANQGQSLLGLGVLSTSEPAKKKAITKGPASMTIASRSEYPISGFPQSLQRLKVDGCQLRKFDTRILRLRNLTSLAIVDNKIQELPDALADMTCLTDLNLENNILTEFPSALCRHHSKLCDTLKTLVLNHNCIRYLPENIGNLSKLISLHVSSNQLRFLPCDIGRLGNLKFLSAKGNKIRLIPFTMKKLVLTRIDFSKNEFIDVGSESIVNRLKPAQTLQDLSCKVIFKERVLFQEEDLSPQCLRLLKMVRKCIFCPNLVIRSYIRMPVKFDLSVISETVLHCESAKKSASIDVHLCSKKCFDRYHFLSKSSLVLPESLEQ